jgi:hypothetical protein
MFSANSRYAKMALYTATTSDGRHVQAVTLPLPPQSVALAGFYQRPANERLDLVAARFLNDPTTFWQLCDANNTPVPDALAARPLVGIPRGNPNGQGS